MPPDQRRIRWALPWVIFILALLGSRLYMARLYDFQLKSPLVLSAIFLGVFNELSLFVSCYLLFLWLRPVKIKVAFTFLLSLWLCLICADGIYFYFTLSRIQSFLFANINIYSIRGVLNRPALGWLSGLTFCAILFAFSIYKLSAGLPSYWHLSRTRRGFLWTLSALLLSAALSFVYPKTFRDTDSLQNALNYARNSYLEILATSSALNFGTQIINYQRHERHQVQFAKYQPYRPDEELFLVEQGLLKRHTEVLTPTKPTPETPPPYTRILIIAIESLARGYIHFYNDQNIPAETTPFLDSLLKKYPHVDNYFTANMPTTYGLNAMILSRLEFTPEFLQKNVTESIFTLLKKRLGADTYLIRGASGFYGKSKLIYRDLFRMKHFIGYEELATRYPPEWGLGWGFRDSILYRDAVRIFKQRQNKPTVILIHTVDLHQPGSVTMIPDNEYPKSILETHNTVLKTMRWVDLCLQKLFENLERNNLFDDKTLVVITADHTPHPGGDFHKLVPKARNHKLARIPLIFVAKNLSPFKNLNPLRYASQIDFAPTLLKVFGINAPTFFLGRDMQDPNQKSFSLGLFEDILYWNSPGTSLAINAVDRSDRSVRARALRRWLRNTKSSSDFDTH